MINVAIRTAMLDDCRMRQSTFMKKWGNGVMEQRVMGKARNACNPTLQYPTYIEL
jgi:hypothetical protein